MKSEYVVCVDVYILYESCLKYEKNVYIQTRHLTNLQFQMLLTFKCVRSHC